jgi:hypothetical protein
VLSRRVHHGHHVVVDPEVGGHGQAAASGLLNPSHGLVNGAGRPLGIGFGSPGRAGHVAPGLGQRHRRRRADPTAGPGHQGHLAFEIVHLAALLFGDGGCRQVRASLHEAGSCKQYVC